MQAGRKPKGVSRKQLRVQQAHEERRHKRKLQETLNLPSSSITAEMIEQRQLKSRVDRLLSRIHTRSYLPPTTSRQEIQKKKAKIPSAVSKAPTLDVAKRTVKWLSLAEQDARTSLSLTEELEKFAEYVQLDPCERQSRLAMIDDIEEVVRAKWPNASLHAFGSFSAGLSIFLSDVDLSLTFPPAAQEIIDLTVDSSAAEEGMSPIKRCKRSTGEEVSANKTNNSHIHSHSSSDNSSSSSSSSSSYNSSSKISKQKESSKDRDEMRGEPTTDARLQQEEALWVIDTKGSHNDTTSVPSPQPIFSQSVTTSTATAVKTIAPVGGGNTEQRQTLKRKVVLDDLFDDDSSATTASYESSSESNLNEDTAQKIETKSNDGLEENLELQLIEPCYPFNCLSDEPDIFDSRVRSLHSSELDFSNTFEGEEFDTNELDEEERKWQREQDVACLRDLFLTIKQMDFLKCLEFRHRARVPIINLIHSNGIECDISVGLHASDTSVLLGEIVRQCGPALLILSAFLKVYLSQLGLDQPFVGGLGSFKLYVLIARHIQDNFSLVPDLNEPNCGLLLLSFLKHYGAARNLNEFTVITLSGDTPVTISFEQSQLVKFIQRAFQKAFLHLDSKCKERYLQVTDRFTEVDTSLIQSPQDALCDMHSDFSDEESSDSDAVVAMPNRQLMPTNSASKSSVSASLLAPLLDCKELLRTREQHLRHCANFPPRKNEDRIAVAQQIIDRASALLGSQDCDIALEDVQAINLSLYTRLRAFRSADRAFSFGDHRNSIAPVGKPTQDFADLSTKGKRYSFSNHGVVGDSHKSMLQTPSKPGRYVHGKSRFHSNSQALVIAPKVSFKNSSNPMAKKRRYSEPAGGQSFRRRR